MGNKSFDPNSPPSAEELAKACQLMVKDEQGREVSLGEVLDAGTTATAGGKATGGAGGQPKTIAIWIRHFYCGLCMDFLSFLTTKLNPDLLAAHNVKLVVIGCGDPSMIKGYREMLNFPFPVFADPSKKTYVALGMTLRTLDAGKFDTVPEYIGRSMLANVLGSIASAFKIGKLSASSGDKKQVGGEFVFAPSASDPKQLEPIYVHRMENTRGHAPLRLVMQAAGLNVDDVGHDDEAGTTSQAGPSS